MPENPPKSALFGQKAPEFEENEQKALETTHLAAIEVSVELAMLYGAAKGLLDDTLCNEDTPANQKAQVLNAAASALQQIAKTRTDLFNSERIRRMEQILIRTLREFPELATSFLAMYERNLTDELG